MISSPQDPVAYLFGLEQLGIKFGLDAIRAICAALGNPQDTYRSIVVAGTNGKGSVTAVIDTALRCAGYAAARYTSPHLTRLEERFVIGGAPVSVEDLRAAADRVRSAVEGLLAAGTLAAHPTFFEATTAVGFELFRRARVEVAVLEVGLGGRLDATNVVTPLAAVITSIALDHERLLGATIREIAFEKAGVIKPGGLVIAGDLPADARGTIARVARDRGATLVAAAEGTLVDSRQEAGETMFSATTPEGRYGPLRLALRGRHQAANALVAIRTLEALGDRGLRIGHAAIVEALETTSWPGRLQRVAVPGGEVVLDAAHNPAGASALAVYLAETWPGKLPIVFGAMHDKDVRGMLAALLPCASRLVVTAPRMRRAMPCAELATVARELAPDLRIDARALARDALATALESGRVVCACGSIFLVGELLDELAKGA
jgi:dihydrofolate synthase/folylpolyglutamate synthase